MAAHDDSDAIPPGSILPELDDEVPAFMYCHEPMIPEHNLADELYFLSETLKENSFANVSTICPSVTRPNSPEPSAEVRAEELVDISPDYITVFNSARRCLLRLHTDDTIEVSDEFVDMLRKELEKYDLTVARKSAIEQMTKRRRTDASFEREATPTSTELLDHILRQTVAYS